MGNENNLIPFSERTEEEQRKIRSAGGKASGEARRRKANFRKVLNALLTAEIDSPEWKGLLESLGVDCTLETALNMAMIKAGLEGNVKAYEAVARFSGQSERPEEDVRNREADTALKRARKEAITGENENDEAIDRLDEILREMRNNAADQEAE